MAAIAFDTLKFARRLKDVGVPEAQAEAQAELMAEAFVFNMDALVTKDYLEQCLDARFGRLDARFGRLDARFGRQEAGIDQKLSTLEARFEKRFVDHDLQFAEVRGELKLHRWMLALILVTSVLPYLQKIFALVTG
jgi:hypothetical protein